MANTELRNDMSLAQYLDDQPAVRIPAEMSGKLSGFRTWATSDDFPEKLRVSFLNGAIYFEMSPEESETHTKVKWEIGRVLLNVTKRLKIGTFYGDGVLLTNDKAGLSTQPDGMFITKQSLRSGRLRRIPRRERGTQYVEFEGAPDLVIEVVSRSSLKKDTEDLWALYYRAGIPEYWLIDALGEEIDFKMLRRGPRQYISIPAQRGWLESPVLSRRFKLGRQRDEDGDWQYDLKVK